MSKKKGKTVAFYVNMELYNTVVMQAVKEGRSVSNYICNILKKSIDK